MTITSKQSNSRKPSISLIGSSSVITTSIRLYSSISSPINSSKNKCSREPNNCKTTLKALTIINKATVIVKEAHIIKLTPIAKKTLISIEIMAISI